MGTQIILAKSSTRRRGLAYYKVGEGLRTIIAVHGIGEGNNETAGGIETENMSWPGWRNIRNAADALKFNIIFTNSSLHDTTDEIDYAIEMAIKDLKTPANKIGGIGLSWGARRWKIWLARDPVNASKLRCGLVRIASGGATYDESKNVAASNPKLPVWIFHSTNDPLVGFMASRSSFDKIKAIDPNYPVYYTQLVPDLIPADDHNIFPKITSGAITPVFPGVLAPTGVKYPFTSKPKINIYRWFELNEKYGPTNPEVGEVPSTPIPIPDAPAPTPTEGATIKFVNYARPTVVQIIWSDGSPETIKAATGDWIRNVGQSVNLDTITVEFAKAGIKTYGPKRKIVVS
jgi:predicted esterase